MAWRATGVKNKGTTFLNALQGYVKYYSGWLLKNKPDMTDDPNAHVLYSMVRELVKHMEDTVEELEDILAEYEG